jgi:hypothetical protein
VVDEPARSHEASSARRSARRRSRESRRLRRDRA